MQSSWRLREQKRKEEAEAAERRRAVEKSEISFPSLQSANTEATWGVAPIAPVKSAAAERWTSGAASVASYPARTAAAPAASTATATATAAKKGVHASISAAVRQSTQYRCDYDDYDDDDNFGRTGNIGDGGWTEVSKTKTKSKLTYSVQPPPQQDDDYDYDCDHQSEY